MKAVTCIMLIDDNEDDNFFHQRVIKKYDPTIQVISMTTANDALAWLKSPRKANSLFPEIIFLDINMPGMNGWEFLSEYKALDRQLQSKILVVMLTTSENDDDLMKSKLINVVSAFKTKPLTHEMLHEAVSKISE